jgi:hypothetical protein
MSIIPETKGVLTSCGRGPTPLGEFIQVVKLRRRAAVDTLKKG